MSVSTRYVRYQGPVLATLGRVAFASARQSFGPRLVPTPPVTPGRVIEASIAPRAADLVRAFVKNVGGSPGAYGDRLPPHMFPQWAVPFAARTLDGLTYPMSKVLNAGCRMTVNTPIPMGERLRIRAWLEHVDDDGTRAIFHQRVVTGTDTNPDALDCEIRAFVPLASRGRGEKKEQPSVPPDAREIAFRRIGPGAGFDFAVLTGDFNPLHWFGPYARAAGFTNVILHGFATFARAFEALAWGICDGDPFAIREIEARFTRPVVLPGAVGIFVDGANGLYVGERRGGTLNMSGTYTVRA